MKSKTILIISVVVLSIFLLSGLLIFLLMNKKSPVVVEEEEVVEKIVEQGEDIRDSEGNEYGTIRVGDQVWMAENLKTKPLYGESWCYNGEESYCESYGRLYNWEAAMAGSTEPGSQGVCPSGWHVPTDNDWYLLESTFATGNCASSRLDWGCYPSGKVMKTPSWGGDEESVLNIVAAGMRDRTDRFSFLGSYSFFWTSSMLGDGVWRRAFLNTQENILRSTENPEFGYSLRCVMD
jgi:uncharacterized protein (TIGR02145 family)